MPAILSAKAATGNRGTYPAVPFDKCAAKTTSDRKPGTSVVEHCVHVGRVSEALFALLPGCVKALLPSAPGLCVGVHDVGKVSPGYELKYFNDTVVRQYATELCGASSFCSHHARISGASIARWLNVDRLDSSPVALAAAAHHGTVDRGLPPDAADVFGGSAWADERRKLIAHLSSAFGGSLADGAGSNAWLLAGLTCVSDWIGSDEQFFPADRPPVVDGDPAKTARCAVAECGFLPVPIKAGLSFEDVFGFSPRASQRDFYERVEKPGVYVMEAPMGVGKTEAALYAAYRLMTQGVHHGFYFGLPTRLTSDRIHERVAGFLRRISEVPVAPKLAHGTAWLHDCRWKPEDDDEKTASVHPWFNPSKRALLYPYAVGTIDQALLSVLNVKHSFVRLFGLAGKVVILDEVHSYDMYTGTLLDELVDRLRQIGCTVIILSATLTGARRNRLVPSLPSAQMVEDYPLMTAFPVEAPPFATRLPGPKPRSTQVRLEPWDGLRVAKEAVQAAASGVCVVCIANTVAKAQAWYRAVKSAMADEAFPVGVLHARFPMFQREKIEDDWMAKLGKGKRLRPRGCVLIATQILEQSVDVDADWMITELAPTDMMLQRMGRLWRHERDYRPCNAPELVVVTQDPSACTTVDETLQALGRENACVYAPYVLMRSHAVWKPLQAVEIPGDIRALIEATYAEGDEPPESVLGQFKKKLAERCEFLRKLALSAQDGNKGFPTGSDDDPPTRHAEVKTREVLLLAESPEILAQGRARIRLLDGTVWTLDAFRPDFAATRHLHAGTVSVAEYLLPDRGAIRQDVSWLDRHFFRKPLVVVVAEDGRLTLPDGLSTGLHYSSSYGVWRADKTDAVQNSQTEPSIEQTEDEALDLSRHDW